MYMYLGGETSNPLANHMSILAKNQSLLSALQKNLSSPNLPASIKSLAARVLASPLGRTQGTCMILTNSYRNLHVYLKDVNIKGEVPVKAAV